MAIAYLPYDGPIVSRREAVASGARRFFTGEPCERVHVSQRRLGDGTCIQCGREQRVAWKAAHRDEINAAEREARKLNPERAKAISDRYVSSAKAKANRQAYYLANTDAVKRRAREWSLANPDRILARRQTDYAANKDIIKQRVREWNEAHPEATRARGRNYRARLNSAEGSHTGAEIKALFKTQRGRCAYFAHCGTSLKGGYHADHIRPLARGGSNWITNIQLTCEACNNKKRAIDPVEYARRIGLLV
jgi:5-methylcytosine-specific restriction endonuclease McrA